MQPNIGPMDGLLFARRGCDVSFSLRLAWFRGKEEGAAAA